MEIAELWRCWLERTSGVSWSSHPLKQDCVSTRPCQPWLSIANSGNLSLQLECSPLTLSPCCPQVYSHAPLVTPRSCWPPLQFPDSCPSWQFPALQLSWATATQAYVAPNSPNRVFLLICTAVSEHEIYFLPASWVLWYPVNFLVVPKLKIGAQVFWNTEKQEDGWL